MKKVFIILLFFSLSSTCFAYERILDFDSKIDISRDGKLTVTETITVRAEGDKIKRGIYRDFPTIYKLKGGFQKYVPFDVIKVTKNDIDEPYFTQSTKSGVRLYIGKQDIFLKQGVYTYSITYSTENQLFFFDEFDEIYWNVTGNEWAFTIENVNAMVTYEGNTLDDVIKYGGYTGIKGSRQQDFNTENDHAGNLVFKTLKKLTPGEGFTIYVDFPKGYVNEPLRTESLRKFVYDNRSIFIISAGFLVVLLLNTFFWFEVGKDPERGVIVPRFTPPDNLAPAAVRFVYKMGYDERVFSAALVSMAVKGALIIEESDDKKIKIIKSSVLKDLSKPEKKLYELLFEKGSEISFSSSSDLINLRKSVGKFKSALGMEFEKNYFNSNKRYLLPGAIMSVFTIIYAGINTPETFGTVFLVVWTSLWTVGVLGILTKVYKSYKYFIEKNEFKYLIQGIFMSVFAIPFLAGEVFGITMLIKMASVYFTAVLAGHIVSGFFFYKWMKAPTKLGQKTINIIEGFKEFLMRVEKDRLLTLYKCEQLPDIFEKFLPYAIALEVEDKWAEKIEQILKQSNIKYESGGWYRGEGVSASFGSLSELSGSLSDAVASASSSASSGGSGGSSGGGGGGGW